MSVLVLIEHDRGTIASASFEALTAGRSLAAELGVALTAVVCGEVAGVAETVSQYGATRTVQATHSALVDYSPEAWASALDTVIAAEGPVVVLACGTDRGNEVLAHVAAQRDVAMVANVVSTSIAADTWSATRVQWGGSLLEDVTLVAPLKLITTSHHAFEPVASPATGSLVEMAVELPDYVTRTMVRDRVERTAGVTLQTARVVVSGGRGVGSPEGFAPLEALAATLGGVVGCSRAVTNNGWRNHTDQVGQTGNRIAPDIYIPCGISGAIQHWVGAMASKKILAINTDKDANMVTRADYAVIGDLHQVVPAITAEIERRRAAAT